jgi:hypothetical protein
MGETTIRLETRQSIAIARKRAREEYEVNYLLSVDSDPKTAKSNKSGLGYYTAILYLAPHAIGGYNVCASAGNCVEPCLHTSGNPAYQKTKDSARLARKLLFFKDRELFFTLLFAELQAFVNKCKKYGLKPCVRLNGTSDIVWERVATWVFHTFPEITFYDYTKHAKRMRAGWVLPSNYSLTFSRDGAKNELDCIETLKNGKNVAICFSTSRKGALPEYWKGFAVLDGDKTDLRFLDYKGVEGVVIGLRAKGRARGDNSGFVVEGVSTFA